MNLFIAAVVAPAILLVSTTAPVRTTPPPQGVTQTVIVKQVIDGDTFVTDTGEHVRVWGINSPEKDEAGYWPAGMFLDMKIRGSKLDCQNIDTDRFGRSVMHCSKDGTDIGSYMVQTGYARDFTKYSKGFYKSDEAEAKKAKRGFWNPTSGISPKLKYTP